MDVKPFNEGHTLLVPKTHYRWVNDVPDFGSYWQVAHQLSLAISQAVCADYISYLTVGNEVPHAHIHIIPRFYNDALTAGIVGSSRQVVSLTSLDSVALKIKAYL